MKHRTRFGMIRCISMILILSLIITQLPARAADQSAGSLDGAITSAVSKDRSMAPIVCEIETERTLYTKTYLLSDNTRVAIVSIQALHYMDSGKWTDIDNSLTSEIGPEGNNYYTNRSNSLKVRFPFGIDPGEIRRRLNALDVDI